MPNRSAATLNPIILEYVLPGTSIYSDQWAAYRNLNQLGFAHGTVNHSVNFKDPTTGVHTNHVEAYWSRIKRSLRFKHGSVGLLKWNHVDEAQYRSWFHFKTSNMQRNFDIFLEHIKDVYQMN